MVVEMDRDKKHLNEDCFTFDEIVQMILMSSKNKSGEPAKFTEEFKIFAMKKLIK
jgi:hypothetical protein